MELGTIKIDIEKAPAFIAGLVREGVTFEAADLGNGNMLITMTGGY